MKYRIGINKNICVLGVLLLLVGCTTENYMAFAQGFIEAGNENQARRNSEAMADAERKRIQNEALLRSYRSSSSSSEYPTGARDSECDRLYREEHKSCGTGK